MTYKDMIRNCTGVNMSPADEFPQLICSLCVEQLNNAHQFKTKCVSSQNMLSKLLVRKKDSNNEIKCEEIEIETNPLDYFQEHTDAYELDFKEESVVPYKCRSLPTTFKNTQSKKVKTFRTKYRTADNKHICPIPICGTSFSSYDKLLRHRKSHTNTCWKCIVVLNNTEEFEAHIKTHNRTDCEKCGKLFEKREQYRKHMSIHAKDKNLCMVCGKNYSSLSSLNAHIRIHTGEKKYKCTHCEKKFIHWSDRIQHIRSFHTKEKPHECHFCKKRFTCSRDLVKHVRSHTGERPYPCMLCDMKFSRPDTLRIHMYKHTGERKVICQICNKGFTKNYNLKQHMVTHTGERNHLCLVCGKAFTQAHVLRGHMKTHPVQNSNSANKE